MTVLFASYEKDFMFVYFAFFSLFDKSSVTIEYGLSTKRFNGLLQLVCQLGRVIH